MARWLLIPALVLSGCSQAAIEGGGYMGQGLAVTTQGPTVGAVVRTYADGSSDVTALVPGVSTPATSKPVAAVMIVLPQPAKSSYTITPERQEPDKFMGTRAMSWADKSPNDIASETVTNRKVREAKPLPAVDGQDGRISASAGGGSSETVSGLSWWKRVCNWFGHVWSVFTMSAFGILLVIAAFFVLPIFIPALGPIFAKIPAAILSVFGWVWDQIEHLMNWLRGRTKPKE